MKLTPKDQSHLVAAYQEQLKVEQALKNPELSEQDRKKLEAQYNVALTEIVRIRMQNR